MFQKTIPFFYYKFLFYSFCRIYLLQAQFYIYPEGYRIFISIHMFVECSNLLKLYLFIDIYFMFDTVVTIPEILGLRISHTILYLFTHNLQNDIENNDSIIESLKTSALFQYF